MRALEYHGARMISRPTGFTLIELMMVVAMMAILMYIAAPSLRDVVRNARMTSAANDLLTDLSVARAEAVKRGSPASVCTSNNGTACTASNWNQGWIIFSDINGDGAVDAADAVLKIGPVLDGGAGAPTIASLNHATNAGAMYVGFRPSGVVTAGGVGAAITFTMCDGRTTALVGAAAAGNRGRQIQVSRTGRAFVQRWTC